MRVNNNHNNKKRMLIIIRRRRILLLLWQQQHQPLLLLQILLLLLLLLQQQQHFVIGFSYYYYYPTKTKNTIIQQQRKCSSSSSSTNSHPSLQVLFSSNNNNNPDNSSAGRTTTGKITTSSTFAAASASLERTVAHLEKLQRQQQSSSTTSNNNNEEEEEDLYQQYIQKPANALKEILKERNLPNKGRKPDLARRLVRDDMESKYGLIQQQSSDSVFDETNNNVEKDETLGSTDDSATTTTTTTKQRVITSFAGINNLSNAASVALTRAAFIKPSPIQNIAIPILYNNKKDSSCILHAATGSGKTLAYILPYTEKLWKQQNKNNNNNNKIAIIITPTRELAAQVAGIATVLAPPNTVRLIARPCNLCTNNQKERGDDSNGRDFIDMKHTTNIYIGSAKAIYHSLYGDGKMPAPPTPKPLAMEILHNTEYLVLDEVDRLLGITSKKVIGGKKKSKKNNNNNNTDNNNKQHEKPAAILTAAITRLSLGKSTIVAASATVGRPLRRELSRCMGLPPQQCPQVLCADNNNNDDDDKNNDIRRNNKNDNSNTQQGTTTTTTTTRAVTIPDTVEHYVISTNEEKSTPGQILTTTYKTIQSLYKNKKQSNKNIKILLVLARNFGINTQNAIGALKHFNCYPQPISLLDALETSNTGGTDNMIEIHRQVSGSTGVGESTTTTTGDSSNYFTNKNNNNVNNNNNKRDSGYLLVTGEDTVRGLHLDGLDVVLIAGRPLGPDEYTHIAGRTGRAGLSGKAITIVSEDDAIKLISWQSMLNVQFQRG